MNATTGPSPLNKQLGMYAAYHRDPRNIATHFFGVPMIYFSVIALLSRPAFDVGGLTLSPVWFAIAAVTVFYARLDLRYALSMLLISAGFAYGASYLAAQSVAVWLGGSIGLFAVGWVIQFIGHYFEGKKPAFVDDLVGLLIGPLFIAAEAGFALGLRKDVKAGVEKIAGPVRLRELRQLPAK
jgi:uncharacterized membrane protein YGL010W